jgi:hypothetical protein
VREVNNQRQRKHWLNKEAYGGGVGKVKRGQPTATVEEAKGEEHAGINRQKEPVFTNRTASTLSASFHFYHA